MADRYWVGGIASWDNVVGIKWSTTSGGPGGAPVPTSSDDVFFTNLSTGFCTIASTNLGAKSINCTGFTGTIGGTASISVAGSVTLDAGMTYTHTGTVTFTGTGTLTTAGKTFSGITVNGAGITMTLGGPIVSLGGRNINVTQGTFATAGNNITAGSLIGNGTLPRAINLGSSTVNLSGNLDCSASTNLTLNAGSSQINLTGSSSLIAGSGFVYNNVSFTSSTDGTRTIIGANTYNNLTLNASAVGLSQFALSGSITITGTLTCAGSSASQRAFVRSDTIGTTRTITAAAVSANDCDFRDITIAGAAAPIAPTRAGNCGGNSGVTFPAAKTVYRVGTAASWSGVSSWSLTSGGTGSTLNTPLAQDTAVIDNNTAASSINVSSFNISAIDASTRTTAVSLNFSGSSSFYGFLTLGSGVTVTATGIVATFCGRGTMDFTSAGKTIPFAITLDAPGGTFRLLGPTTLSTFFTLSQGTLNLNNFTLTSTTFTSINPSTRTIAFGTGNLTVTGTGTVWNTSTVTGLTVTGTPVVNVTNATATATTVSPGSPTETDSVSFNFTGGTYTLTLSGRQRNLDFTGFAGTLASSTRTIFGDLKLSTGMTIASATSMTTFASTSTTPRTITTNGRTINVNLSFDGIGGSWRLLDAMTLASSRGIGHVNGTIDLNGSTLNPGFEYITVAGTKNLTFNGGTLTCSGVGGFNNAAPTGFTTTAGTGTGTINMIGVSTTFAGGGSTYNCTLNYASTGDLSITGNNTITTISNSVTPTAFLFQSGSTTTLTNWNINGTPGNRVDIISDVAGSHTLSKASGTVSADYLLIQDSIATGGAIWLAGANSIDSGGNSGWIFSGSPPVAQSNFFMLIR